MKLPAEWIDTRFQSNYVEDTDLRVMGDLNSPKLTGKFFAALASRGLKIPKPLVNLTARDRTIGGSNLGFDARFDQILHRATVPENFTNRGGALDFFIDDAHIEELFPGKITRGRSSPFSSRIICRFGFRSKPTSTGFA
ncbi:MAG: hypothetical protein ACR2NX_09240 [Chthoniobacterales bacterium]